MPRSSIASAQRRLPRVGPDPGAPRGSLREPARLACCAALCAGVGAVVVSPAPPARADSVDPGEAPSGVLTLPGLANTDDGDRELLREVDDAHVHPGPAPGTGAVATSPPAPTPAGRASPGGTGAIAPAAPPGAAPPTEPEPTDPWSRLRASARLPVDPEHEAVRALRQEYVAEAVWVTRILERGTPWIEHLVDELDRRFLPLGLAVLPAVESGFRPGVTSSGGASGLWQIVPITAREIGMERSVWFDARGDIIESTTAALDYLSYLNAEFDGDWELTLAAYNAGPGRVRGAIRANREAGEPTDFWSLKLPAETRRYVPKVLALVSLLRESPSPILVPDLTGAGFERVDVGTRISVDRAAALSGIPEEELRRLNAGLVHGVTAPDGPHALYLPRGAAETFLASVAGTDRAALYSLPLVHEVVAGDTLSDIAHRYGLSQAQVRDMNALADSRVLVGQKLAVIDVRRAGAVEIEYVVGAGDTLSGIARSHDVGLGDISRADGSALDGDVIRPGQTLSITIGARDGTG